MTLLLVMLGGAIGAALRYLTDRALTGGFPWGTLTVNVVASLGLGIVNDAFYPALLDKAPDDYSKPLQLVARGIRFVDPISGSPVEYRSRLELSEAR